MLTGGEGYGLEAEACLLTRFKRQCHETCRQGGLPACWPEPADSLLNRYLLYSERRPHSLLVVSFVLRLVEDVADKNVAARFQIRG
jgi:hypothetical protein